MTLAVLAGSVGACGIVYGTPEIQGSSDGGSTPDGSDTLDALMTTDSGQEQDALPVVDTGVDTGADAYASDGSYEGPWADSATGSPPACSSAPLACGAAFPGSGAFATSQDAANAIVGQWAFCNDADGGGFFGMGQLGEEFTADGTYYQLIMGSGGQLARNLDPTTISSWEIQLLPHGALEIHTGFMGGDQRQGGLSACPPALISIDLEIRVN